MDDTHVFPDQNNEQYISLEPNFGPDAHHVPSQDLRSPADPSQHHHVTSDYGQPSRKPVISLPRHGLATGSPSHGLATLHSWLNKMMRISMIDGRVLIGVFVCVDRDKNVILGSCQEYLSMESVELGEEPRALGLAMVAGVHIETLEVDSTQQIL